LVKLRLWIIAGCNGAGKSSFSKAFFGGDLIPFDYDKCFLKYYHKLQPSDLQDRMAHNLAFEELERQTSESIDQKKDFCYETNFNSTPVYWPEKFKENGFETHLIYFVLDSLEKAKKRVDIRVENGGHFVPVSEIQKRYFEGFDNQIQAQSRVSSS
jgi:predicted ABC-type ATPase